MVKMSKKNSKKVHDKYGKKILQNVLGDSFVSKGPYLKVKYTSNVSARIDGIVDSDVAVEIESRTFKQIRGAIIDLISHPFRKKLLILVPANFKREIEIANASKEILDKYVEEENYKVVLLNGTGNNPKIKKDSKIVKSALAHFGK